MPTMSRGPPRSLQHLSVPDANLVAARTKGAVVSRGDCSTHGCANPSRTRGMCHACYMRWHTRQTAFGRFETRYVDPEPAREHVQLLQGHSMSLKAIAAAAGVSDSAVRALLVGKGVGAEPSKRLLRAVANNLLAVPVPPPGIIAPHIRDGQQVDGTGTRRRLRALIAAGHSQSDLCTRLGWPVGSVNRIVSGRTRRVTAGRHRETVALFQELQLIPGGSVQARARALRSRWALPFQWDEETIDDPHARAIQCRSQRRAA